MSSVARSLDTVRRPPVKGRRSLVRRYCCAFGRLSCPPPRRILVRERHTALHTGLRAPATSARLLLLLDNKQEDPLSNAVLSGEHQGDLHTAASDSRAGRRRITSHVAQSYL